MNLSEQIEQLLNFSPEIARRDGLSVVKTLRDGLNSGEFRAAEKTAEGWKTNIWVKRGILLAFKIGAVEDCSIPGEFRFFDKDTLPAKTLTRSSGVRVVPGGWTIRAGAYAASKV